MLFQAEAENLKKSSWPRCDQLAQALAAHGSTAADALEFASSSRTHHVRSAALRALATVAPDRAREVATKFLSDKAYEVRETAAETLGVPTPP
jgi:HEAT repeat protein